MLLYKTCLLLYVVYKLIGKYTLDVHLRCVRERIVSVNFNTLIKFKYSRVRSVCFTRGTGYDDLVLWLKLGN